MESRKMVLMNLFQNSNGDASLEALTVKNLPAMQETWVQSLRQEDPLEKEMATPLQAVFLPEESHGQRSLAGSSPWGLKELNTTPRLTTMEMETERAG